MSAYKSMGQYYLKEAIFNDLKRALDTATEELSVRDIYNALEKV